MSHTADLHLMKLQNKFKKEFPEIVEKLEQEGIDYLPYLDKYPCTDLGSAIYLVRGLKMTRIDFQMKGAIVDLKIVTELLEKNFFNQTEENDPSKNKS